MYHLSKTEECETLGIHLIHVFEDEWKNKQPLIKEKIKSKFIICTRIGARKLEIKTIPFAVKNKFLAEHHIQGGDNASYSYGAYLKDTLVAVVTFCMPRLALGQKNKTWDGEYELSRFATSVPLVGILQKFISRFKKESGCKKIFSYADRRFTFSKKNIYEAVGFKYVGATTPNYWYFQNGYYNRHHRFGFRKSKLNLKLENFDPTETEWQNYGLPTAGIVFGTVAV